MLETELVVVVLVFVNGIAKAPVARAATRKETEECIIGDGADGLYAEESGKCMDLLLLSTNVARK